MPYIDTVNEYSRLNSFEYDHRNLFNQVQKAMQKSGDEREKALQDVLKSNYVEVAAIYEPLKKRALADARNMGPREEGAAEAMKKATNMANPPVFLTQYINIICAMAMDIDSNYKPKFMLGIELSDAKNLISAHLSSYPRYEETKLDMQKGGWEQAYEEVERSRYSTYEESVRDYATAGESMQGAMKETYIRKEIVKDSLNSSGFFWKLFHRKEVREMRNFIRVAEQALRDINFPKSAEKEAQYEYSQSAALEEEYKQSYKILDAMYGIDPKAKANENAKERLSLDELREKDSNDKKPPDINLDKSHSKDNVRE